MIKDKQIAELCGMTQRNLSCTYKRHKEPEKRKMYELLRLGAEVYFKETVKPKTEVADKIERLIAEQERQLLELRKIREEIGA